MAGVSYGEEVTRMTSSTVNPLREVLTSDLLPDGYTWNWDRIYVFLNRGDWVAGTHEDTVAIFRQNKGEPHPMWAYPVSRNGGFSPGTIWHPLEPPYRGSLLKIVTEYRLLGRKCDAPETT